MKFIPQQVNPKGEMMISKDERQVGQASFIDKFRQKLVDFFVQKTLHKKFFQKFLQKLHKTMQFLPLFCV